MTHSLKQVAKWNTHTHTHSCRHALMQARTHPHTPPTRLTRNLWTSQVFWVCGLLTHLSEFKWLKGCLEFSQCESERTDTPCACPPSSPHSPLHLLSTPLFTRITITVIQPPISTPNIATLEMLLVHLVLRLHYLEEKPDTMMAEGTLEDCAEWSVSTAWQRWIQSIYYLTYSLI